MSLKTYLVGIAISTFLCWSAFFLTLTNIDPFTADQAGIGSFFVSFFLGTLGLIIMALMYFRSRFFSVAELYEKMPILVRQSFFISFGLSCILAMQAMRVLTWWTALMLVLILTLLEISFHTNFYYFQQPPTVSALNNEDKNTETDNNENNIE